MRLYAAVAATALSLLAASSARAATFDVTGFADAPGSCTLIQPTLYQCPTLRAAVDAANGNGESDFITIHAGAYSLTSGPLVLSESVFITGEGARSTTVQVPVNTPIQAFRTSGTADVQLANMTIQGGQATDGNGGNIFVASGTTLSLVFARVTGGRAFNGGGVANDGTLVVTSSLIDGNTATSGGGIFNGGVISGPPADVSLLNTTLAGNTATETGGAIGSEGATQNTVALAFTTVARNSSGLSASAGQDVSAIASIIANNGQINCLLPLSSGSFSLESGTDCALPAGDGNKQSADPQIATAPSDQGGPTDVLAIPASSPAVDMVLPCFASGDQRNYQRVVDPTSQPCDAGAYEQSGTPTAPAPTPTPQPPAPTATPTPTPTPVANRSVAASEVKGTVLVKLPGSSTFVDLSSALITNGAEVDARKGRVEITTSAGEKAVFYDGLFKISQANGLTTLTLTEKLDCAKKRRKASAAAKKPKTRKLWGDGKGKFRTKGTYSAATVRGTKWLVQDGCRFTRTTVAAGVVSVRDAVKRKIVILRKGRTYTARPRR